MERANVHRIVFSSSATVYSDVVQPPFREDSALGPINPYGRTKLMIEQILGDLAAGHVAALGAIGELPAVSAFNLAPCPGVSPAAARRPCVPPRR